MNEFKYCKPADVAAYFNVSTEVVYKWVREHGCPISLKSPIRLNIEAVKKWDKSRNEK